MTMTIQSSADRYAECADHIHTHTMHRIGLIKRIFEHWIETRDFIFSPIQCDPLEYEEKFEEFNVALRAKIIKMQDLLLELNEASYQTTVDEARLVELTNAILIQAIGVMQK